MVGSIKCPHCPAVVHSGDLKDHIAACHLDVDGEIQQAPPAVANVGKGTLSADLTVSPAAEDACWKVMPEEAGDDNLGPFTTGQLGYQYNLGIIHGQTQVWREGMQNWMPLDEVPELQHMLSTTSAPEGGVAGALAEADVGVAQPGHQKQHQTEPYESLKRRSSWHYQPRT